MTVAQHDIVKFGKAAAQLSVGLAEREAIIPNVFTRIGFDDFKGALDDTVNIIVPGILPAHEYAWRNDRAQPMQVDKYTERKIPVKLGTRVYSRVQMTDEQYEFDLMGEGWKRMFANQMGGISSYLDIKSAEVLKNGKYAVSLGARDSKQLLTTITAARHVLNKFRNPMKGRVLLVGTDFDSMLQLDPEFNKVMNVGASAESAVREANIGRVKGFDIIVSNDIPSDEAYALAPGAFAMAQAAPHVPDSAPAGGTAASNGFAMRWLRQYDPAYAVDESVVDAWAGWTQVLDPIDYVDGTTHQLVRSEDNYGIRAVKIKFGASAADLFFAEGSDRAKVAKALGLDKRPTTLAELPATA